MYYSLVKVDRNVRIMHLTSFRSKCGSLVVNEWPSVRCVDQFIVSPSLNWVMDDMASIHLSICLLILVSLSMRYPCEKIYPSVVMKSIFCHHRTNWHLESSSTTNFLSREKEISSFNRRSTEKILNFSSALCSSFSYYSKWGRD